MNIPLHVFLSSILHITSKGQITIPRKIREFINTDRLQCMIENGAITLRPIRNYREYSEELEAIAKDYCISGGYSLKGIEKTL